MKKLLKLFTGFFLLIVIIHVFLINYTFNLDITGISRNKVDIEWRSDDYNFTVVKKGVPIMFIPFTYGPSFFKVHIKDGPTFEVGNWRTHVWDIPDYDIKLTKTADKYILEFTANDTDYTREIHHYNFKGQRIDTTKIYYKNGQLRYVTPFFNPITSQSTINNMQKGIAMSIVTKTDYSIGAYFCFEPEYTKRTRYTQYCYE